MQKMLRFMNDADAIKAEALSSGALSDDIDELAKIRTLLHSLRASHPILDDACYRLEKVLNGLDSSWRTLA